MALLAGLAVLDARPAAAQVRLSLGAHAANTETNALGLSGTAAAWWPSPAPAFGGRLFLDGEKAVGDFKKGLDYEEPDRHYIIDEDGVRQRPKDDDLWESKGWDIHAALYGTVSFWHRSARPYIPRISLGVGGFYNGHDGGGGFSALLAMHTTERADVDVEYLEGGSFRIRVSAVVAQW